MKQPQKMQAMTRLFSPAVLALALLCWGSTALATVTPIAGIPVGLEGDPGSVKFSTKTGADGAFNFTKLPAGKYKLKLDGLRDQSLTVGIDGIARGKVMRGSDGGTINVHIFLSTNVTSKAPRPGGGDEKPGN